MNVLATNPLSGGFQVSHSHLDHLDEDSVASLAASAPRAVFVAPKGVAPVLRDCGAETVLELDWWEQAAGRARAHRGRARSTPRRTPVLPLHLEHHSENI